MIGLNTYTFNV